MTLFETNFFGKNMNEETEQASKEPIDIIGTFVFVGGSTILTNILKLYFPFSVASPLSIFICGVFAYFLSVRGKVNPWSKNKKKWTFLTYFLMLILACFFIFILGKLFFD